MDQHSAALDRAHQHALDWLSSLDERPVPPQASIDQVVQALGAVLPEEGSDAAEVVDLMAAACGPGLTAMRISVSNWSATENDVERSLAAVRKAVIGL